MPRAWCIRLFVVVAVLAVACPSPHQPAASAGAHAAAAPTAARRVECPMRLLHDIPFVQLRVDSGPPEWFILDTGAPVSVFSSRVAARARHAPMDASVQIDDRPDGGASAVYSFDGVRLGDATLNGVAGVVTDRADFDEATGLRLGGILGFSAFDGYLLTLDYPARRVVLEHGALPDVDQRDVLYLTTHDLHPAIATRVAGRPRLTEIDSGSGFFLELPTAEDALPFAEPPVVTDHMLTIGGRAVARTARLRATMTIGTHVIENPTVMTTDPARMGHAIARIGGPLLAHFVVTFDTANGRARFASGERTITAPPVKTLGVEFVRRQGAWQIMDFVPPSAGPALGLAVGDRVVTVDGKPSAAIDANDLTAAPYERDVRFVFARGQERLAVTVPVTVLVP